MHCAQPQHGLVSVISFLVFNPTTGWSFRKEKKWEANTPLENVFKNGAVQVLIWTTSTGHLIIYIKVPVYFTLKLSKRHFCINRNLAELVFLGWFKFKQICWNKHAIILTLKLILKRLKCLKYFAILGGSTFSDFSQKPLNTAQMAIFVPICIKMAITGQFGPF